MDLSGTWTVYSEENLDEFLRVIGENILIIILRLNGDNCIKDFCIYVFALKVLQK